MLVGPSDAADVVSIAFSNCTERLDGIDNVRAYLFRTVTNTAASQQRSTRRRQIRDLHAVLPDTDSGGTGDLDVRRAVAALSVQQRAVTYFTYWHDHTPEQIGQLLGIAAATVRRHLARARLHLRKALT